MLTDQARAGRRSNAARSGRARAKESEPGPRFALDAGTRTGSSPTLPAQRAPDRIRCGLDLGDRAGEGARALRVFEAVTGEHADHPASFAQLAVARALAKSGNGRGRRRLAEDPFASRDEL